MPRIIEEVAVKIGADTRGLDKGLKKSKKQVGALSSAFKKLGATMIGVFGARALFTGFKRTLDSADQLIKTAKGVGFTVNEYQRLIFALDQVGVSAGSAKIAIGDFQKRLSKAVAGVSPQFQKAFEQAGLDTAALSKMSPAAAFSAAMTHLATLRDSPAIAGLTGNVFEEQSGKDVLQVLRQFEKYTAARENFERRVGTLNKGQVEDIQRLREETKLYGQQWEMLKMQIVGDAAPDILSAFRQLDEAGAFKEMATQVKEVIKEINLLVGDIKWLAEALQSVQLPEWLKTFVRLTHSFNPVAQAARAPFTTARSVRTPAPDLSRWTRGTSAERSGGGTVVNQTNNFSISREENARLSKAWKKLNDQHQRAGQ
jgi:hypothetical protein